MAPRLSAFWDEQSQNRKLFLRGKAVRDSAAKGGLTPEQPRLVEYYHDDFVRSGAQLDAAGSKRLAALNQRLATLYTTFNQNVLADEKRYTLLENEADLAEPLRMAAAAEATARGQPGKWAVANTRPVVADFLRRDLREKVWRNYDSHGDHGDAHDNNAVITRILAARAEQAKLMGFPTHAHRQLQRAMVKTPERAMQLLEMMWTPAVARVKEEVAAMTAIARSQGPKEPIAPWDYRYYAEKVRKQAYGFDDSEVKPYLQLETLREGMFWAAGQLFGFTFTPAPDVPVYPPDVRVFAVKDRETGRERGLLYFDPYAREGKYNGGQTETYRVQERFRGEVPALVAISMPFVKPGAGSPALLGWRDAQTLFHEFGHARHTLNSDVTSPALGGTRVVSDYAEFPSKLFEHWLATPEVLGRFAVHHATGQLMPQALVARLQKAATFNQGFYTVDFLTSALVEMKMHLAGSKRINPDAFERDVLRQMGAPAEVGTRFRMPHFGHVFASNAYAAGYYRYLWADMLAADAFEAFQEGGGAYDAGGGREAARARAVRGQHRRPVRGRPGVPREGRAPRRPDARARLRDTGAGRPLSHGVGTAIHCPHARPHRHWRRGRRSLGRILRRGPGGARPPPGHAASRGHRGGWHWLRPRVPRLLDRPLPSPRCEATHGLRRHEPRPGRRLPRGRGGGGWNRQRAARAARGSLRLSVRVLRRLRVGSGRQQHRSGLPGRLPLETAMRAVTGGLTARRARTAPG